ncbi:MAG: MBL fold metallo-hydrolase, partial [Myxococcales bacterium]|nr:MBL fold metallo-hydrolase [Myxococcales bacterium]
MAATEDAPPGVDLSQVVKIPTPLPWSDEFKINVYLIEANPLTLIDCGIRGEKPIETIERAFAERGRRIEDIEQIVITHAHFDHYGSGAELVRRSGARVFAHPIERVHMEHFPSGSDGYRDSAEHYFRLWGVDEALIEGFFRREQLMPMLREDMGVDVNVEDGDRVKIEGFNLEAIHVPGHCQGHLCYLNRARGILFSGDHLLPNISPVPLLALGTDPSAEKPKSFIQFLASLEKIERFPARIALP